jgi:hypothetical protein
LAKQRVHWTLPSDLLDQIAARAAADDRSEPYMVEKLLRVALMGDLSSGQARETADAFRGAK